MTARDEIAEIIDNRWHGYGYNPQGAADAILAAGYRKPRIINTVEELTVVPAMASLYSAKTKNFWFWLPKNNPALVAWGTGGGYTYETDFIKFEGPLTVLHEGEVSL